MEVKIKAINVGRGDCFFLCLSKEDKEFNIMIDCMKYNDDVKAMVEVTQKKHINLLVVTHIDNDHVPGVTDMLDSVDGLTVDEIWFNCYQREPESPAQELTQYQKERLMELKGNLPIVADLMQGKVDAEDARLLSEAILDYEKRVGKNIWKREYVTTNLGDVPLGKDGEWGNIHIVSPTIESIKELDKEFRKMFRTLFFDKHEEPLKDDVSIYELMIHYVNQKQEQLEQGLKVDSADEFNEAKFRAMVNIEDDKDRLENVSSIAFVWSYEGHRVLFAGDANHKQLAKQIGDDYNEERPLIFDAIKVSHHGSTTGTSLKLMELIDSGKFFIPCGTKKVPSLPTMAKIITRDLPASITCRNIHYNKATENIRQIANNADKLLNLPKYELKDENEFEFTC